MPAPMCLGPKTWHYVLKALGIIGCLGSGFYTTYGLMWNFSNLRFAIVFIYLITFCVVLLSAELGLLEHRHFKRFGRFLTTFVGRAFFYIFIGGLLLDGIYGWIIGIYLMSLGVINVIAQCSFSSDDAGRVDALQPQNI